MDAAEFGRAAGIKEAGSDYGDEILLRLGVALAGGIFQSAADLGDGVAKAGNLWDERVNTVWL